MTETTNQSDEQARLARLNQRRMELVARRDQGPLTEEEGEELAYLTGQLPQREFCEVGGYMVEVPTEEECAAAQQKLREMFGPKPVPAGWPMVEDDTMPDVDARANYQEYVPKSQYDAILACLKETAEELSCWIEEESPSELLKSNPRYLSTMDRAYRTLEEFGTPCQWAYPEPDREMILPGGLPVNERQTLIDKVIQVEEERDALKAELEQHRNSIKAMLKAQNIAEEDEE